jgi:hypothetical protein
MRRSNECAAKAGAANAGQVPITLSCFGELPTLLHHKNHRNRSHQSGQPSLSLRCRAVAGVDDPGYKTQAAIDLPIACHLRCRLLHLQLRAHPLDLRCLLFQLRGEQFHSFLLLGHGGF